METSKPNNGKTTKAIVVVVIVVALIASLVLVLRFVPLKHEETQYHSLAALQPQQTYSTWFQVPPGYTIDGSYWTSSSNSATVKITFKTPTTPDTLTAYSDQGYIGSFKFNANSQAIGENYTFTFTNPASSPGPLIIVTYDFKIYGTTTYLK